MFSITVNEDGTLSFHKKGKRSSIAQLNAEALVKAVNQIPDHESLYAVFMGIRRYPYSIASSDEPAAQALAKELLGLARCPSDAVAESIAKWKEAAPLSEWRKYFVQRYMGGMNAPGDLWIGAIALACANEKRPADETG